LAIIDPRIPKGIDNTFNAMYKIPFEFSPVLKNAIALPSKYTIMAKATIKPITTPFFSVDIMNPHFKI
jgi:hypothetical protein